MRELAFAVAAPFVLLALLLAHADEPVYDIGHGVSAPKLIKDVQPQHTGDSQRRGVEGKVLLKCVVDRDGVPQQIVVFKSLDAELDEESVKALQQWRFEPGMKDGKPVSVRVQVEMAFVSRSAGTSVETFGGIGV